MQFGWPAEPPPEAVERERRAGLYGEGHGDRIYSAGGSAMRSFSSRVPWVAVAGVAAALGCASVDEPPPVATRVPGGEVRGAGPLERARRRSGQGRARRARRQPRGARDHDARGRAPARRREGAPGGGAALRRRRVARRERVGPSGAQPGGAAARRGGGPDGARAGRGRHRDLRPLRRALLPNAAGRPGFGSPPPGTVEEPPFSSYRPAAALALVGRDGMLVWFDWGPREETRDPEGPVNARRPWRRRLRLLAGEPEDA